MWAQIEKLYVLLLRDVVFFVVVLSFVQHMFLKIVHDNSFLLVNISFRFIPLHAVTAVQQFVRYEFTS